MPRRDLPFRQVVYINTVLPGAIKPGNRPPLRSVRLLDQLRERIRYCHYSLRTEQAYVCWVRCFIRFHGLRHPRAMGAPEVEAFLQHLVNGRNVPPSTHKQALCAILFLYREALSIALPWMQDLVRPRACVRAPGVPSRDGVARLLAQTDSISSLIARLRYGTGLRRLEGLRLRIEDLDFDRDTIVVRCGKGGQDWMVMMPASLRNGLRKQAACARKRYGRTTAPPIGPAWRCRTHWPPSTPTPARLGAGSGCSPRAKNRWTRAAVCGAAITRTKTGSDA